MALKMSIENCLIGVLTSTLSILLLVSTLAVPIPAWMSDNGNDGTTMTSTDWRIEVVDPSQCGYFTSLDLDSNGYPHISYHDDTPDSYDLRYARWTGSGWTIKEPDPSSIGGQWTSIALDSNNSPHISYYDVTNQDLRYTTWNGAAWAIKVVDFDGGVGEWTSIAIDSSDIPHISYYDSTNKDLKYANRTGGTWNIAAVDFASAVGKWTSIALDSNDVPHISYYDLANQDLKYSTWNGTAWVIKTVDSLGEVGLYTSIALDSNDNPYISYYDLTNMNLKYTEWNGSAWNIKTVDSGGDVGWHTSIAIDSDDNPHMSYRLNVHGDLSGDLRYAKRIAGSWSIEAVDYGIYNVGEYTSLALDDNDDPHIAYFDHGHYDVKYATKAELEPLPEPILSYTPDTLDFGILSPGIQSMQAFEIWNSGIGTLTYSLSEIEAWITDVSPLSGSSLGEHDTINVTVDTTGLPQGPYNGSISIVSDGGVGAVGIGFYVLPQSPSVSLNVDPDTLNLKSKGRWITAYLSAENASLHDIDVSTILLQDVLVPERWDYQDDVLMLKFNRQEFKDTVQVGESVQVKIAGKWEDGSVFEAYDSIRVIDPGG